MVSYFNRASFKNSTHSNWQHERTHLRRKRNKQLLAIHINILFCSRFKSWVRTREWSVRSRLHPTPAPTVTVIEWTPQSQCQGSESRMGLDNWGKIAWVTDPKILGGRKHPVTGSVQSFLWSVQSCEIASAINMAEADKAGYKSWMKTWILPKGETNQRLFWASTENVLSEVMSRRRYEEQWAGGSSFGKRKLLNCKGNAGRMLLQRG